MPSQDQTFPVGSLATLPGWGSYDNLGPVPHFPTDLMFNDKMEIVGDDECAKMYEGRRISFCDIFFAFGCVTSQSSYKARKNGLQNVINATQAGLGRLV